MAEIIQKTALTENIIASDAIVAADIRTRTIGWIGHTPKEGEAIIFPGCRAIHTCFMKKSIDLLFINGAGAAVKAKTMLPWRFCACPEADTAIELPEGTIIKYNIRVGDKIICRLRRARRTGHRTKGGVPG